MPSWLATLFGALAIGTAIVGSQFVPRYQIAPAVDAVGNPFAWRLDVRTGEVESCRFEKNPLSKFSPDPKEASEMFIRCSKRLAP
jgi:hypothetical protein